MADLTEGLEFVKLIAAEEKDNYLKVTFEDNKVLVLRNVNGKIEIERQG